VHGATVVLENVPGAQPTTQLLGDVEPGADVNPAGQPVHCDAFAGDHHLLSQVVHDLAPTLDDVPAGQTLQGSMPVSEYMPPGHRRVQLDELTTDEKPSGHFVQTFEPSEEKKPAWQTLQRSALVCPISLLYEPAGQGVHDLGASMPLFDQVPAGHRGRQPDAEDVPANDDVPATHCLQVEGAVAPSLSLYVPARHLVQASTAAAPADKPYVPEGHFRHVCWPLSGWYSPIEHFVQLCTDELPTVMP